MRASIFGSEAQTRVSKLRGMSADAFVAANSKSRDAVARMDFTMLSRVWLMRPTLFLGGLLGAAGRVSGVRRLRATGGMGAVGPQGFACLYCVSVVSRLGCDGVVCKGFCKLRDGRRGFLTLIASPSALLAGLTRISLRPTDSAPFVRMPGRTAPRIPFLRAPRLPCSAAARVPGAP